MSNSPQRNEPCPCGSGKRYKNCCQFKGQQRRTQSSPTPADDAAVRLLIPVGRSGLAIAAGYLGLCSCIPIVGPLALLISIFAIIDIQKSKRNGPVKYGMGRAVFGLAMGVFGCAILLMFLPFWLDLL